MPSRKHISLWKSRLGLTTYGGTLLGGESIPQGDPNEIPSGISTPEISLTMLDGQEISGITIETENEISAPFDGSPTSISFGR